MDENKELEPEENQEEEDSQNSEGEESPKDEFSDREKQLYARTQKAESKIKELGEEIKSLKSQKDLSPEDKEKLKDKESIRASIKEVLNESKAEEKVKEEKFQKEVDDILEINSSVKRADFLRFIEEKAESYGIESVSGAMKLYRDLGMIEKQTTDKVKKDISGKPKFPKSEGSGESKTPPDDKDKSLWQIAQEAIKGNK